MKNFRDVVLYDRTARILEVVDKADDLADIFAQDEIGLATASMTEDLVEAVEALRQHRDSFGDIEVRPVSALESSATFRLIEHASTFGRSVSYWDPGKSTVQMYGVSLEDVVGRRVGAGSLFRVTVEVLEETEESK